MKTNNLLLALSLALLPGNGNAQDFAEDFARPDGLITNEYAHWHPTTAGIVQSPVWEVTSGSLFASGGAGWTGVPDVAAPNAASTGGTNSAVFRTVTDRRDFGDFEFKFRLLNQGLRSSGGSPPHDWDGVHLFLRYQSEVNMYYASFNRRDNTVVIKKKVPGGPSNGGTYYSLTPAIPYLVPYNTWQQGRAVVHNDASGSVTIELYANDRLLVAVTDDGSVGGAPIRAAGGVGFRGDNADLKFDDLKVAALGEPAAPAPDMAALAKAPQKFLSPALADGINDSAVFGPEAKEVTVLDLRGSELFRASRISAAGITWDCRDRAGRIVPSGVYIAKIVTDDARRLYQSFAVVK